MDAGSSRPGREGGLSIYEAFRDFVLREGLFDPGDTAICGLSGGADSVAMLCLLKAFQAEVPFSLVAVHVHHGIRGEEADRDEAFVVRLCERRGVPLRRVHLDVPSLAKERGVSLEAAGRLARREVFEREAASYPGRVRICLAHHLDDQAETVLFHLCRGSGLRGMAGMRVVSGDYVRPVLCLHKGELLAYLTAIGQGYVTDSTNASCDYTRNRIRHQVVPELERNVHPGAGEHLCEAARMAAMAEDYFVKLAGEKMEGYRSLRGEPRQGPFLPEDVLKEPEILQTYLVRACLEEALGRQADVTNTHVRSSLGVFSLPVGRGVTLLEGILCQRVPEGLWFGREEDWGKRVLSGKGNLSGAFYPFRPGESLETPWGRVESRVFPYHGEPILEKKYTKWFDYDKISPNLALRTRREGDYLVIAPTQKRKLLRRDFIDAKVPSYQRDAVPLLTMGQEVLWVIPDRLGDGAKVFPETRMVLEVSIRWM